MSRYFYDTEFLERPHTIELVSIGIIDERGRSFYAENHNVDWSQANPWVLENVKPHLIFNEDGTFANDIPEESPSTTMFTSKTGIAEGILEFVGKDPLVELWGFYSAYDHVALMWLFGTMADIPKGWPKKTNDVRQLAETLGKKWLPPQTSTKHNALEDARWTKEAYEYLTLGRITDKAKEMRNAV